MLSQQFLNFNNVNTVTGNTVTGNNVNIVNSNNILNTISTTATSNFTSNSDISTIFIIGFPDDFKERELVNMFLFAPGFEGAVLKTTNISDLNSSSSSQSSAGCSNNSNTDESQRKQLIGFVKFSKPGEASYALEILNGKILDQERGIVLKAEIAKKNLFIKLPPTPAVSISMNSQLNSRKLPSSLSDEESSIFGISCSFCNLSNSNGCSCNQPSHHAIQQRNNNNNRFMSITLPGQSDPALISAPDNPKIEIPAPIILKSNTFNFNSNSVSTAASPPPQLPALLSKLPHPVPDRINDICALQKSLIVSPTLGSMAAIVGENFPCNTLYVGNLPPSAQEEELRALFRNCLGYRRLSFRPKSSGPMCFVEFEDIACATAAMETLYGTMISCSSPLKGGIRLSFSKNPLGLRVASPLPSSSAPILSSSFGSNCSSNNSSFMEAIGAETDNPDHRQAIATIFAHYHKNNPRKNQETRPLP